MKTVMVTGAGGYIGCVLVPKLLKNNYKVIAVDRFFFGKDKLDTHKNLVLIQDDTRCLSLELFKDVDFVIDLVAISNDPSGEIFDVATWQINHQSRVNTARLAKQAGVKRYILPSSCSIYGFNDGIVDETSPTNPLTTYAKANEQAEKEILPLASDAFVVTVMRQSTIFGYSPRMRFDLAINGMTHGAWSTKKLPLMRDGTQYRPMVHIQDTTDVMLLLLTAPKELINGEIFNVGGEKLNYKLGLLGEIVARTVESRIKEPVMIEWYGASDNRSYQVSFEKIKKVLNWEPRWDAAMGVNEILDQLISGNLVKSKQTITLEWYQELDKWYSILKNIDMYGGILNINKSAVCE